MPSHAAVDVLAGEHPVQDFWRAHCDGSPIALGTSGTSGQPRVIIRTTASWVNSFDACATRWGFDQHSRLWVPGTLRATMNLFAACLAEHVGGQWSNSRDGLTHAALTPTQLMLFLDADPVPGVRVLVAGDRLAPSLRRRAEAAGLHVDHYYGAAELSLVAWGSDADDLHLFDHVEAELRDVDHAGAGTLWVRSPWLSDVTRVDVAHDEAGFASVGDLATLDGTHLRILGRPGAVTTAGSTVQLSAVEARMRDQAQHPLAVLGLTHPVLGSVLCCVAHPADLPILKNYARRELDGPLRPRRWVGMAVLPTTEAGKIDRRALEAQL